MVQVLVEQTAFLIMEGQTATAICLDARHIAVNVNIKLAHGEDAGSR